MNNDDYKQFFILGKYSLLQAMLLISLASLALTAIYNGLDGLY